MVLVIFLVLALPPWLRPTWLVVTAWILPIVFVVFVGAVRVARYLRRKSTTANGNQSINLTDRTVRLSPQAWPILITVVVYVLSPVAVLVSASQVLPAMSLGERPARATALAAGGVPGCSTCPSRVSFSTAGQIVTAPLAGAIDTGNRLAPGLQLVFDRVHPNRVMTVRDWQAGRSASDLSGTFGGLAILLSWTGLLVVLTRRRQHQFKDLRPGVGLRSVRRRQPRRGLGAWLVSFVDGKRATYVDDQTFRDTLRERLRMPGADIAFDDQTRATLELIEAERSEFPHASL